MLIALHVAEQDLKAFLDDLAHDAALQEKLKGTKDLDAAFAVIKESDFDVSKADLLRDQLQSIAALTDEELESTAGEGFTVAFYCNTIGGPYTCAWGCQGNETILGACQ